MWHFLVRYHFEDEIWVSSLSTIFIQFILFAHPCSDHSYAVQRCPSLSFSLSSYHLHTPSVSFSRHFRHSPHNPFSLSLAHIFSLSLFHLISYTDSISLFNMDQSQPLFCLFSYNFNNSNRKKHRRVSNLGRRKVGADETTELWRPTSLSFSWHFRNSLHKLLSLSL